MLGRGAGTAALGGVVAEPAGEAGLAVEHRSHLDATADELVARGIDAVDDEVHGLRGPGCSRRERGTELDRTRRAGWCELHQADSVVVHDVGVDAPIELLVELARPVDVADGNYDNFELHVHEKHPLAEGAEHAAARNVTLVGATP